MLVLTSAHTLEVVSNNTAVLDVAASYVDADASTFTPARTALSITTATTTTVVTAPGGGLTRTIRHLTITNTSVIGATISLHLDLSATPQALVHNLYLPAGARLEYTPDTGFAVRFCDGQERIAINAGARGRHFFWIANATPFEAAGTQGVLSQADATPGAMVIATPGVAGVAADAPTLKTLPLWTPNTGNALYITDLGGLSNGSGGYMILYDLLWYNTGLNISLTTAQTVNSVSLPARDNKNDTLGAGVLPAVWVRTTTTNAATVTLTISYTNSNGVAGRSGTLTLPVTATAGTFVTFNLAAGDSGVRSIQTYTASAGVGGALSLVMVRALAGQLIPVTIPTAVSDTMHERGARIHPDTVFFPSIRALGTSGGLVSFSFNVREF